MVNRLTWNAGRNDNNVRASKCLFHAVILGQVTRDFLRRALGFRTLPPATDKMSCVLTAIEEM